MHLIMLSIYMNYKRIISSYIHCGGQITPRTMLHYLHGRSLYIFISLDYVFEQTFSDSLQIQSVFISDFQLTRTSIPTERFTAIPRLTKSLVPNSYPMVLWDGIWVRHLLLALDTSSAAVFYELLKR